MSLCLNSLVTRQLRKLSLGLPLALTSVRWKSEKKKAVNNNNKSDPFEPHFGERIYMFHHFLDGIAVYSTLPVLQVCPCLATSFPFCSASHPHIPALSTRDNGMRWARERTAG